MAMGVGLRPNAKALELPPNPTVRAPVFYPTANKAGLKAVAESVEGRGPTKGNDTQALLAADTAPRNARHRHAWRTSGRGLIVTPKVRAV